MVFSWFQVGFHGFSWFQVGFHGIFMVPSWFRVNSYGFSWFLGWFFMVTGRFFTFLGRFSWFQVGFFYDSRLVSHYLKSVFMVFNGSLLVFLWFQVGFSWFFVVPGGLYCFS